jgi:hypothetical protein
MTDAVVIGVVGGTADEPRTRPLERPLPVTAELLALAEPASPTEVFRFAAPCLTAGCRHFEGRSCTLAAKVTHLLPAVSSGLPECDIRPRCRWFAQEGETACHRCPQIVTDDPHPTAALRLAADPAASAPP